MSRKSNLAEVIVLLKRDITALEVALDRSRVEEKRWAAIVKQRDSRLDELEGVAAVLRSRCENRLEALQLAEAKHQAVLDEFGDARAAWLSEREELESRAKHAEVMLGVAQQRNAELCGAPAAGAPEGVFGQFVAFAARVTGLTEEALWQKVATHMQLALVGRVVSKTSWYVEPEVRKKEKEIKTNENK